MTEEQIRAIVKKATFAPSGDNCQPWTFEWDGQTLFVKHDESRARHPFDPMGTSSVITLGCLLESIQIGASDFKLRATYTLGDLVPKGISCWAQVRFAPSTHLPDPLSQMIESRSTDRRLFSGGELSADILNGVLSMAEEFLPAQLHLTSHFSPELINYVIDSEQILVEHPEALPAVMNWVRFSIKEARRSGDGISWRNMLAKYWEIPLLLLIRKYPSLLGLLRSGMIPQFRKRAKMQLQSSAGLICVSIPTTGNALENAVHAGRLMMRTWLQLTKLGYGVQPETLASVPIFFKYRKILDSYFNQKLGHISDGERILRQSLSISEERIPIWMIRTGRSLPLPPELRTFRRPIDDVLKFV